jgi:hypothetical protein
MLGAKNKFGKKVFKRQHPFFLKGIFCCKYFFSKKHSQKKNQKLIFKENIATIRTTTSAYNFEETCENVSLEHF